MLSSLSLDPRYDELLVSLHQVEALLDVVTNVDIADLETATLNNYFGVAVAIIHKAKSLCEDLSFITVCSQTSSQENIHAD